MIVVGLTGSIGMGKSTAARILRRMGLPLHDADQAVHCLMGKGGRAVAAVEAVFPGIVVDGAVDRARLAARVFEDAAALRRLEGVLHPEVRREARAFVKRQARYGRSLVVLDIPLLFETGGEALCDVVVVVTAPAFVQEARVLARPEMTRERLRAIRAKQMPDMEKRRCADFVVQTGLSKRDTLRRLGAIVRLLRRRKGRHRRARARLSGRCRHHPGLRS
ncbi:MAG: dephospho-CoA kinase [Kiloniellaceae bacterium]